jgi:hypothetical protein
MIPSQAMRSISDGSTLGGTGINSTLLFLKKTISLLLSYTIYRIYSIVLTKACFLHHKYLVEFNNRVPQVVLNHIDKGRNGEDIAMAFIVANISMAPPVWVKVSSYETSTEGISSGGIQHFIGR